MQSVSNIIDQWVKGHPRFLDWSYLELEHEKLEKYPHEVQLKNWLSKGYHGSMNFMENHLDLRLQIRDLEPDAKYVFQFLVSYPFPLQSITKASEKGRVAQPLVSSYAQGNDYHQYCYGELNKLKDIILEAGFKVNWFRNFTDSAPVFERDLAQLLGLGWIGKNACLINRQFGSSFFLAGFVSDVEVGIAKAVVPAQDFCGACTRCIDACPTDAIESDGVIRAKDCISYWTIEHKGALDVGQGENLSDWIFGCDICQQVCPWNHKEIVGFEKAQNKKFPNQVSEVEFPTTTEEWLDLLQQGGGFKSRFKNTSLYRGGRKKLLRNLFWFVRNRADDPSFSSLKKRCLQVAGNEQDEFQSELLSIFS